MIRYGKTSQTAVSVMSFLAINYNDGKQYHSSKNIAKEVNLTVSYVGKLLTQLSNADLVEGNRGPSGGYRLAKCPSEISLFDIVSVFEDINAKLKCPTGRESCHEDNPCSLHQEYVALYEYITDFLQRNRLDKFIH